jgi:hypothetical protein
LISETPAPGTSHTYVNRNGARTYVVLGTETVFSNRLGAGAASISSYGRAHAASAARRFMPVRREQDANRPRPWHRPLPRTSTGKTVCAFSF